MAGGWWSRLNNRRLARYGNRKRALRYGLAGLALLGLAAGGAVYGRAVVARATLAAPDPTPILYDRQGRFLAQFGRHDGARVDYGFWPVPVQPDGALPDRILRATLALEDRRFWRHPGVDPLAAGRALWQAALAGRSRSGASTIAMQTVRMQHPAPRTLWNKAVEAGAALVITARHGRAAVLAEYLRLVPYGNGSHGIAHAARWYFDKPVADLSWAEIALLSALPQAPALMNPARADGLARAKRRAGRLLALLAADGTLPAVELPVARAELAGLRLPPPPRRPEALHALLRLDHQLRQLPLPLDAAGEPRIRTMLDSDLQVWLKGAVAAHLAQWAGAGAQQAAVMVVQRADGAVLAALGSSDYGAAQGGAIDFTQVSRSPGSTFKPFIYAQALERGVLRPDSVMADLPEGASGIGNADGRFLGPLLPRQALANSRNIPATNLLRQVGLDNNFRLLQRLGLHDFELPAETFGLSMAIGGLPTSLDRLVEAYDSLAEDGVRRGLVWFRGQPRPSPFRVLATDTARVVTLFLSDPMARLPSFPRNGPTEYPFPVALKTGTSQGYRDAWIVAWSRDYMVGVWVGRPDSGTMTRLSGARTAALLARTVLLHLHGAGIGDLTGGDFPAPSGYHPQLLCGVTGRPVADGACAQILTEWLPGAATLRPGAAAMAAGPELPAESGGDAASDPLGAAHLSILAPEHNSRLWRNPEVPAALQRIALKAAIDPPVPQIVWYVDGLPFATTDPDRPVAWTLTPGAHSFQVRLPFRAGGSRPVRIVVE